MNKHRHRIVFNKARGLFMAVAECAGTSPRGQTAQATSLTLVAQTAPPGGVNVLTMHVMLAWGVAIVVAATATPALAQIVADHNAPGSQRPTVINAANGVPVVNIQAPSNAGVSRNTYSQFDVQRNGVILNNSSSNTLTQLGGWVQGNPGMTTPGARIILNEVTSGAPSLLKGFMEVAGSRAQLIVANPAGIACDGCGFINANRGTLTTGTPVFDSGGNLNGYRVTGGAIEINGLGLLPSPSTPAGLAPDYTDLISRALKVNAGIWANQLLVTTGVNQVSTDQSVVTPLGSAQATGTAPAFAIDTAQLGGMYAGKIVLVGTEAGVGVRNAGQLSATSDSLTLTTAGQLLNSGTIQAHTTLSVDAASLNNQDKGEMSAHTTSVTAGALTNTGLIDGYNTTVRATTLTNLSGGRIYGDFLAVAADTLTQTSQRNGNSVQSPVIAARQRLDIGAGTLLNQDGAVIFSVGDLNIGGGLTAQPDGSQRATGRAQRVENHSARIEAMGSLSLSSQFLGNYNEHFSLTAPQLVSTTNILEYALAPGHDEGSNLDPTSLLKRFAPGEVYVGWDAQGNKLCEVDCLRVIATGEISDAFTTFQYTRTISETQVATTAPGLISAAQNVNLDVGAGVNDKSRIQAGQTLTVTGGQMANVGAQGQRVTKDNGQQTSSWRHQRRGEDDSRTSTETYQPADKIEAIPQYVGQQVSGSVQAQQGSGGTTLPTSSLFKLTPTGSGPVVEGDPRFINQQQWLSSDYMLAQLSIDPATVQKRLGDGLYEQALVRDQVAQLTGKRFLDGYSSDEAQYRALLDNGVTVARALNLRPGVALSAEQAAHLTSDLVLLEATTVTLPSGQTLQVLQPRVYLVPRAGDLQANGDLMAAQNLNLHVSGDVINSGGMGARQVLSINAANIRNLGGSMAAQDTSLNATQDIDVQGGTLQGQRSLTLTAGQDVKVASTTASSSNAQASATYIDRIASLYVSDTAGQLLIQAARDARLQAAQVTNDGAGGTTAVQAGRDIQLGTVQTQTSQTTTWDASNHRTEASSQAVGSTVATKGDIRFLASRDLAFEAVLLQSELGTLEATAAGNVNIEAGQSSQSVDEAHVHRSSGFMSSKSTAIHDVVSKTQAQTSSLSAANVTMQAGQNLTVRGSGITSTSSTQGNTTLQAGQDVQLLSAQDSLTSIMERQESKSGLSIGLQSGVGVGHSSTKQTQQTLGTTQAGSSVSGQNVRITAQRDATVQASTVLADQDIAVQAGRNLDITAADNTQRTTSSASSNGTKVGLIGGVSPNQTLYGRQHTQQDGQDTQVSQSTSVLSANGGNLTLTAGADSQYRGTPQGNVTTQGADLLAGQTIQVQGNAVTLDTAVTASDKGSTLAKQSSTTLGAQLSGTVGSRITSAWTMAQASNQTDNQRLARAERLKATYDAYKLAQGVDQLVSAGGKQNATDTSTGSAFGVSVSLGNSSSQQQSSYDSKQVRGTNAQAQTIDVKSRDADITAVGAKLQATDITLDAANNLNLVAAQNTASQESSSKGHNAGVGVTIGFGQQNGISFQIGVGGNRGTANGSETTYDNTLVTATNQLHVKSGADTTLQGAQIAGDTVKAEVGGKLNIVTLQDKSSSDSKQESYGANISLCIPPICYGNVVTGSVNVSQSGFNHNYQSAVGQSGIAAGQGGFDIKVQGDTSLTGAAITSTADKSKNSLQTASLSYQDLQNQQDTDSYSRSIGLAYNGGSTGSTLAANGASNLLGNIAGQQGLPKNGSDRSQTLSVISPATITLTGTGNAQKDQASQRASATLTSRDAKTANGALTNTLTLQQAADAQKDIQHAQENAQAGQIVGSVAFNVAGDVAQHYHWEDGSTQKIVLHGIAGFIQAAAGGQNGAAGALAAMGNEALTKQINDYINKSVPITADMTPAQVSQAQQSRKELAEASASLLGATTVALAGGVTGKGSAQDVQVGGQVALTADKYNRQLHAKDQANAKKLYAQAKAQGLPYTLADIEDALRYASTSSGETVSSNTQYQPNASPILANQSSTDPLTRTADDLMVPGNQTNAKQGWVSDGQGGLIQNIGLGRSEGVPLPKADLVAFIQTNTGANTYNWPPGTVQSVLVNVPLTNNGGQTLTVQRQIAFANGQAFSLPVAQCPAVSCTNDTPIAWASTDPADQQVLAAYKDALAKEQTKTAAKGALVVGTTVVAPATLLGTVVAGGVIGGGNSAIDQKVDTGSVDGQVVTKEAVKGAAVGAVGYGVVTVGGTVVSKAANAIDGAISGETAAVHAAETQSIAKTRIENNATADMPGLGSSAVRDFKPGSTYRAENINAGQVTDRDGLQRIDDAKFVNDNQVADSLGLQRAPYYQTARPAWMDGTIVSDRVTTQPETYRMVVDAQSYENIVKALDKGDQLSAAKNLGGWATKDPINTVSDVRNNLAISSEWKGQGGSQMYVVEFTVKPGVGVREGTVGPMFDKGAAAELPGGGSQVQFMENTPRTAPDKFVINPDTLKPIK